MTDSFQVTATSSDLLQHSHLVEEMAVRADSVDSFPVIYGEQVATFHDVEGGYVSSADRLSRDSRAYHVVNLIHRVQGDGSPIDASYEPHVEAHIGDAYFYLDCEHCWQFSEADDAEYPEADSILSLKVTDYQQGPYSFSDELQLEVDKREREYSYE